MASGRPGQHHAGMLTRTQVRKKRGKKGAFSHQSVRVLKLQRGKKANANNKLQLQSAVLIIDSKKWGGEGAQTAERKESQSDDRLTGKHKLKEKRDKKEKKHKAASNRTEKKAFSLFSRKYCTPDSHLCPI